MKRSLFSTLTGIGLAAVVGTQCVAPAEAALVNNGVTLVQIGGTFDANNLAIGGTAFAPNIEGQNGGTASQPTGYGGVHTTTGINDGAYGNTGAWLAGAPSSFVGLDLGGPVTISRIAYGRDNLAQFGDRASGLVTVQFTNVATPDLTTTDTGDSLTGWQTIGTSNYTGAFPDAVRHAFTFDPVQATGIRLITAAAGRGIDELEVYSSAQLPSVIIQDETTNAQGLGFAFGPIAEPAPGDGNYRHTNAATSSFTWTPGLVLENVTVDASWGVSFNHNQNVEYFFDPDGAGPLPEISLIAGVNQTLLADQSTAIVGGVAWSDFFEIASGLDLTIDSVFRVTGVPAGGSAPEALTSAVWRFSAVAAVPEPGTLGLLSLGVLALVRRRRQQA